LKMKIDQFNAVYYVNKVTDLLVTASTCPVEVATHKYGCAYNINKATLSGLTLGGSLKLGHILARANLDLQDPKDDTTGLQLTRRAKNMVQQRLNILWQVVKSV